MPHPGLFPKTSALNSVPARTRVALYRGAARDGGNRPYSLDGQEQRLRSYVANRPDWEIVANYAESAGPRDMSGRPELTRLLRAPSRGDSTLC